MAVMSATLFLLGAMFAPAAMAAAPQPAAGSVTVDGDPSDWSLGTDFFADMTDAGAAGAPVRGKLYLRYDCDEEVLSALVLAQGGERVRQDRPDEAYIRIDGGGKLISPSDGDFAWVNGDGTLADGWEGAGSLAPGSYTLRAHVLVADDSADGYTPLDVVGRDVALVIDCGEVAPTQGTPKPKPTERAAPTGGVQPATGRPTLPATDTADVAASATTSHTGIAIVLGLLATAVGGSLLLRPVRRRPVTVEETIEDR
jgi:hypothetical protein